MKITVSKLKQLIREAAGDQSLPSLEEAEKIVDRYCYRLKGGKVAFRKLIAAMEAHPTLVFDQMLEQYAEDARLPDDDDQKEGMDTADYCDMALEELRRAYATIKRKR